MSCQFFKYLFMVASKHWNYSLNIPESLKCGLFLLGFYRNLGNKSIPFNSIYTQRFSFFWLLPKVLLFSCSSYIIRKQQPFTGYDFSLISKEVANFPGWDLGKTLRVSYANKNSDLDPEKSDLRLMDSRRNKNLNVWQKKQKRSREVL